MATESREAAPGGVNGPLDTDVGDESTRTKHEAVPVGIGDPADGNPAGDSARTGHQQHGIKTVKSHAIYNPGPPIDALAQTQAARAHEAVEVGLSFCVDVHGHTTDIEVPKGSGDADVDRICRDVVKTWRFKPFLVDGKAIKTCTNISFKVDFQ